MSSTSEQLKCITTLQQPDCEFLSIEAVSGSGKTYLLTEIAKALKPSNGLYIAYSKAIATEASKKFPSSVTCSTTHSLAYQNTVRTFGLRVGFFGYRDIQVRMPFEKKILVVESLKDYCLSRFVSIDEYIKDRQLRSDISEPLKKYLGLMKQGTIDSTHDFYLKYYHILLSSGSIKHDNFDLIMLDEAGDLNEVTLEIFKLLPATKKVMVGDPFQNIFQFNKTINGFRAMADHGIHLPLSQSFRVDSNIAKLIQGFCREFMDPKMVFKGIDFTIEQRANIKTTAFISRTNGMLISEMIKLNELNKPYGLTRPAKSIFELPLGLISLNKTGTIKLPQYKHLEEDYRDYHNNERLQEKSFYGYLSELHSDDISIKTALGAIMKHGPKSIIETFEKAKSHEGGNQSHTLCTSHSSKGLEWDSVYIADDIAEKIKKIIESKKFRNQGVEGLDPEEVGEMNLAYVSFSRAKYELLNAKAIYWTADMNFEEDEFNQQLHGYADTLF